MQEYKLDSPTRRQPLSAIVISNFQHYICSEGFLRPDQVTGKWGKPWETALALRKMLESKGFVEDEHVGNFFTGEEDYDEFMRKTFLHHEPILYLDRVTMRALQRFFISTGCATEMKIDGICGEEVIKAFEKFATKNELSSP